MRRRAGEQAAPRAGELAGMRMAELAQKSGVARETIHFYLREGLLPRPRKGGRTVAFYGEEHLERLRTIRRLREEKYLPLAVIRRLLDSPATAAERDVDALAEVLQIDPTLSRPDARWPAPPADVVAEALARGLLGPGRRDPASDLGAGADPTESRVLAIVAEASNLSPPARALTLSDLEACAEDLTGLVAREAELFFDAVFASGDASGAIAALRAGRGAVARFITAYRDLMLRRIVEEVLLAVQRGSDVVARAATVPLSPETERALGVPERRAALRAAVATGGPAALARLAWHLMASGASAELAALDPAATHATGPEIALLVAFGAHDVGRTAPLLRDLELAASAASELALGQILLGEAALVRALRRRDSGASLLEDAVPALRRLVLADPSRDKEPVSRALGWFHRGRVELALPPVLGRRRRGVEAVRRALALVAEPSAEVEPIARARIAANARLSLGRAFAEDGDREAALRELDAALLVDPGGPIRDAVAAERAAMGAR